MSKYNNDNVDSSILSKQALRRNPDIYFDAGTPANHATLRVGNPDPVDIERIESLEDSPEPLVYRITTVDDFDWPPPPGEPLIIANIRVVTSVSGRVVAISEVFNGSTADLDCPFDVIAKEASKTLRIRLKRNPEGAFNLQNSTIGNLFQVGGNPTGTGGVQEGNSIIHTFRGYYSDTGSGLDGIARDNIYYDVYTGAYLFLGGWPDLATVGTVKSASDPDFAEFTCTSVPLGLWKEAMVLMTTTETGYQYLNGFFEIIEVLTDQLLNGQPRRFKFKLQTASSISNSVPASIQEFYRLRSFRAEGNLIILSRSLRADCGEAAGMHFSDMKGNGAQRVYRQVILQGNTIGQLDESSDTRSYGIGTTQIESGGVRENLLRVSNSHPLWQSKLKSGTIDYLENQGPNARLAQGEQYDSATQSYAMMDDLQSRIEDALIMSL